MAKRNEVEPSPGRGGLVYQQTMDDMMEGVQIIGSDWRYLYLNDVAMKHSQRTREELLGYTMMEVYPGIEKTEMFSHLRRCMKKRISHTMDNEFTYPDGTKSWFELSIQPVRWGVLILSQEITKRKKAEEMLRANEEKFEIFANYAYDWVYWVDKNRKFVYISPSCENISGYRPEEFIGDVGLLARIVHPEDRALFEKHRKKYHFGKQFNKGAGEFDFRLITKSGKEKWVSHICRPIFSEDGGFLGRRASVRDITERRKAEERILQLNQMLDALRKINQLIIKEENPERLMQSACGILAEKPGIKGAWIAIADDNFNINKVYSTSSDGKIAKELKKLRNPPCLKLLIKSGENQLVVDKKSRKRVCGECVLQTPEADDIFIISHSAHGSEHVFLAIILPASVDCGKEEQSLAREAVGDISYALHMIKVREKRRRLEEVLRNSETQLKEAQNLAHIGSWKLDLVNNVLTWSDEIYHMFEIDPKKFGASYESFLDYIHPDDRERVNKAYSDSVKNRRSYEIKHRLLMKDGRIKFVHERGKTFYNKNGNALRSIGTVEDITERKKAEERIVQLNRILGTISEINQMIVRERDKQKVLDETCRIIVEHGGMKMAWVGMADPKTYDVQPVAEAGASREYLRNVKVTWDNTPFGRGPVGTAIRTGKHCIVEDIGKTKIYLPWIKQAKNQGFRSSAAFPIYVGGKVIGALGVYSSTMEVIEADITKLLDELAADLGFSLDAIEEREERRKNEEKIKILAKFPEENPNPVMRVSKAGIILYGNKASQVIMGATKCFIGGRAHELCLKWIKDTFKSGSVERFEAEFGGRKFSFVVSPMREKGYANLYAMDVTERVKAEEALRASEENYRQLFTSSPAGVFHYDKDFHVTGCNDGLVKMLKATKEKIIGLDLNRLKDKSIIPILRDALKGKEGVYEGFYHATSGPANLWISLFTGPIFDEKGEIKGAMGIMNDISERMKANETVKEYASKLETEVTTRTKQYLSERDRAEALSVVKDDFIKNITHELKTPLSVIMGNLALLKDIAPAGREREWSNMLDMMDRNSTRLSGSIDQILELSRISAIELRKERIYLKDILNEVHGEHLPITEMKKLEFNVHSEPVVIFGDAHLLRLAINNLVSNAIKFTDKGSVTLRMKAIDGSISISVTDTGIGMSPENQKRIFEKFFKADSSAPGTGIGLNIVKQIVEKHGGKISVKSRPGKGSTFEIILPRGAEAKAEGEVMGGIKKKRRKHKEEVEETRLLLGSIAPKEWAR